LRQKCSVLYGPTGAYDLQNKSNWTRVRALFSKLLVYYITHGLSVQNYPRNCFFINHFSLTPRKFK
jgi:hypothetical protein